MGAPPTPLDLRTKAALQIDFEHHEIHQGNAFTAHYADDMTGLGKLTVIAFFTPPGPTRIHMIADVQSDDESIFTIEEVPTIDLDEGVDLDVFNRDRDSPNTSLCSSIQAVPTVGSLMFFTDTTAATANISGTELYNETIGQAGTPNSLTAGAARGQREFILKAGSEYAYKLATNTANATFHKITLNWYEHIPAKYIP